MKPPAASKSRSGGEQSPVRISDLAICPRAIPGESTWVSTSGPPETSAAHERIESTARQAVSSAAVPSGRPVVPPAAAPNRAVTTASVRALPRLGFLLPGKAHHSERPGPANDPRRHEPERTHAASDCRGGVFSGIDAIEQVGGDPNHSFVGHGLRGEWRELVDIGGGRADLVR